MVMQEGSVFRWRADSDVVESVLSGRRMWGRVALTPDGSRVAMISYQSAHVADLTVARPQQDLPETHVAAALHEPAQGEERIPRPDRAAELGGRIGEDVIDLGHAIQVGTDLAAANAVGIRHLHDAVVRHYCIELPDTVGINVRRYQV